MSRVSKVAQQLVTLGQALLRSAESISSELAAKGMFASRSSVLGTQPQQTLPHSSRAISSAHPFLAPPRSQEVLQTIARSLAAASARSTASEKASSSQRSRGQPSKAARVDPTKLLSIPGVGSKNEALFVAKGIIDVTALRKWFQQECKADEETFKDQLLGTVGIRHPQHRHFIAQHIKQAYEAEEEQKSTLERQLTLSVEGNISSGKSTFLKGITAHCPALQDLVSVVPEPVDRWQSVGDRKFNLLDCFYKEPERFAYTFQNYIFFTRMMQEKDSRAQTVGGKPYRLLERSIFCDRMVFVEALHDAKYLTDMELSIYESWFDPVLSAVPTLVPDGFIYLRAKPDTCLHRMHMRSRSEETSVSLDYLEQLHSKHEDWLYSLHANSIAGMDAAMQKMEQEMGRRPELQVPLMAKELARQAIPHAPVVPDLIKSEVRFLRKDKNPRLHGTIDQLPALVLDCEADLADLDAQKEHAAKVNQYFDYVRQNRLHRQKMQCLDMAFSTNKPELVMPQAVKSTFSLFNEEEQYRISQILSSNGTALSAAACR